MERHFTLFAPTSLGCGRAHACKPIARNESQLAARAVWRAAGRLNRGGQGP